MNKLQMKRFGFSVLLVSLFLGCTEVDVKYPDDGPDPGPDPDPETESPVVITPSGSFSSGSVYYFYDASTGVSALSGAAKSDGSFEGKLPFGSYRMLAVDNVNNSLELKNMDKYGTASAWLLPGDGAVVRSGDVLYSQIDDAQLLLLDDIVVEEGKTAEYLFAPCSLVSTLTLTLDLNSVDEEIASVSGSVNGFYPGVTLSTGQPVTDGAASTSVYFAAASAATRSGGKEVTVTIRSLGLLSPVTSDNTPVYESVMRLNITTASGAVLVNNLDLTEALVEASQDGELPSDINVSVAIESAEPAPSGVRILPATAIPSGSTYYIYGANGNRIIAQAADADGNLELELSVGNYRLLAVPSGLSTSGMENYATASVSLSVNAANNSLFDPFAGTVSILREEFEVEEGLMTVLTPSLKTLAHKLMVSITATAPSAINSLSGFMNGVYPSVLLSSGAPANESLAAAGGSNVNLSTTKSGSKFTATVYTLGFLNPSAASGGYTAKVGLSAVTALDGTLGTEVDITSAFSALADAQGVIPSGKTLNVTVEFESGSAPPDPDPVESNPGTGVDDWEDGEESEGEMK